ncbi:hypothetical protein [Vulcaniibacterium tengchongense]|uniref:Uncharacterized protein n=1 Tax=Vulcaniibacterium tengchongense TaxID=1273429 RepID=A0A3N4VSY4_9GAMM|nr:hypothetical protein [Vulcaniibacterium tengchongense]RPE80177.1 hypothetical protein EDC50_2009 [Vulcaniibacterium tengchongense]
MPASRPLRYAYLPLMLLGMGALFAVASRAVRASLPAGSAEFLLLAWILAFVLALPAALLLLGVAAALRRLRGDVATVPCTGVNVP